MAKDTIYCQRCNKEIDNQKAKWLELSITDGNYYDPDNFPQDHESQGCFSFGIACAVTQMKETMKNLNSKLDIYDKEYKKTQLITKYLDEKLKDINKQDTCNNK